MLDDVQQAIHREKQLKGWTRAKKLMLIKRMNPEMEEIVFE
jgi:predicted GIY-YIG superfamily endonuclease